MGPLNNNYQEEAAAAIYHFAHHHPLHLSYHHNQHIPCSACTHPASVPAYGCQHCNYYLHVSCSKMPQQLQHPFDSNKTHALMLLPKPVYPEGVFGCDACGHQGSGFSYHCAHCRIDLHILCAALPSVAFVPSHHHQLTRMFAPPYPNNKFMCDVCAKPGSKTWLYSCGACQFDVHLGCTRGTQQPVTGKPANRMPYNSSAPGAARPGPQIMNPIINGALEGISSAVAESVANMVMGGIAGEFSGAGAFDASGIEGGM